MTWKKTIGQKRQIQNVDGRNNVPDGGWGWVVTFACCIGIAISMSFVSTFGLFYSRMIEEFQLEMTTLTLVGAAHTAIAMAGAIVVVPIVEKCGERIVLITGGLLQFIGCFAVGLMTSFPFLFLFIGIIWGIGSSLTYVTFLMSVDKYFHKKKAIAISLASTGASLSMTIFTPVAEVLLDMYGFSGGMMVFAAISLNTVVCGAVVFPLKGKGNEVSKTHDPVDMSFCKRPGFIIYLLSNAMFIAGYYIPIGLLPETASSTGVSLDDISLTFSLSGLIQILGRLVFGFISHRCPSRITKLWISYLVAMGLTLLIIPFSTTLYHYLIFNLFGGFFIGLVFISHGVAEHCLWYTELAMYLIESGFYVFSHDHVGHGQSEGDRVHIDDFSKYVTDIFQHVDEIKTKFLENTPVFLIGHSMGGTIAVLCGMERPTYFTGVVLIAPALIASPDAASPVKIFFGKIAARVLPQICVIKLNTKHVSRDKAVVKKYEDDPLVWHHGLKAKWGLCLLSSMETIQQKQSLIEWPFITLHGDDDKMCDVVGSQKLFDSAKSQDKEIKVYKGHYHQLHGEVEPDKKVVLDDIRNWLMKRS